MALLAPIGNLLYRLQRSGTDGQSGFRRRETILVNQLCLVGVIATSFYGLFFTVYGLGRTAPLVLASMFFLAGFIGAFVLNGRGRTIAARNMAIGTATVEVLITTYAIGNNAGFHLYYFALGGLSSLIHTRVRADVTFALATTSAILFLVCQFALDGSIAPIQIAPVALTALFALSALGTVFLCAYFPYVYRLSMYRAECELAAANRELAELSGSDALTRLANRRRMDEKLHEQWRRLARDRLPMSVLMIDADHFKQYNDRHGHQAGDECLRRLATLATSSMQRATDTVARYGGEEFIAILPETSGTDAMLIAERFRATVEQTAMGEADAETPQTLRITVSVGVSTAIPDTGLSPETLISSADRALYEAKLQGRNQVVFCPPGGSPRQTGNTAVAD